MLCDLNHVNNHANYRASKDDRLSQFAVKTMRLSPSGKCDDAKLTAHFNDDLIGIDYAFDGIDIIVKVRRFDRDRDAIAIANFAGFCGYYVA